MTECKNCQRMKELLLGCLDYMQKCGTPCPPNTCEVCDQYNRVNTFLSAQESTCQHQETAREDVCQCGHLKREHYQGGCGPISECQVIHHGHICQCHTYTPAEKGE